MTYLDPPTNESDDETTVIFTQGMNRISIASDSRQADNSYETNKDNIEERNDVSTDQQVPINFITTHDETTQAYRHGRCHLCDKPITTANLNPTVEFT